jgi:hypothetical protein
MPPGSDIGPVSAYKWTWPWQDFREAGVFPVRGSVNLTADHRAVIEHSSRLMAEAAGPATPWPLPFLMGIDHRAGYVLLGEGCVPCRDL